MKILLNNYCSESSGKAFPINHENSRRHTCLNFIFHKILSLLLNIMFHAPMGRNNLFLLPIFPPSSHSIVVFFFPVGISSLTRHSQQVQQELRMSTAQARRQKKLQHPTRSVENVALTTKGLQERKTQLLNGTTLEK